MSISNPIITINGASITTSDISKYELTYNKLWKNANRDMDGNIVATLIGVYPNISLETKMLTFNKAQQLSGAINQDYFDVTYWDTQTSSHRTARYYAADHRLSVINECTYASVTVELVAVSKSAYI